MHQSADRASGWSRGVDSHDGAPAARKRESASPRWPGVRTQGPPATNDRGQDPMHQNQTACGGDSRACRARAGGGHKGHHPCQPGPQLQPATRHGRSADRTPCTRARTKRATGRGTERGLHDGVPPRRKREADRRQTPVMAAGSEPRPARGKRSRTRPHAPEARRRAAVILARVGRAPAAPARGPAFPGQV
jgi:hypothetical protein